MPRSAESGERSVAINSRTSSALALWTARRETTRATLVSAFGQPIRAKRARVPKNPPRGPAEAGGFTGSNPRSTSIECL